MNYLSLDSLKDDRTVCVCVAGWHYPERFYYDLSLIPGVKVYVVSHRKKNAVPQVVQELIGHENFIYARNEGYDWGCYQQFLETGIYRRYDFCVFMHDDMDILDKDFIAASMHFLNSGAQVVGNGRHDDLLDWPSRWPWSYAHSTWVPPSLDFCHPCVRGSYLATTKEVLTRIGSFEVFWDRWGVGTGTGNWSQVATCGKISGVLGNVEFKYLSDTPLVSQYLIEYVRGCVCTTSASRSRPGEKQKSRVLVNPPILRLFYGSYRRLGALYVRARILRRPLIAASLAPLVKQPSRRFI